MEHPEIDLEELESIARGAKEKSELQRMSRKQKRKDYVRSHNKPKDNRNKKSDSRYKICPVCKQEITRRTSDGRCIKCNKKIHLAAGEYFIVDQPFERLMIHNWSKYTTKFLDVDIEEVDDISELIPSPDKISPLYLKNEAWAAQKLLELCGKDFQLAKHVINVYHESTGRADTRQLSLHYIVSYPGIKALIYKAKNRLYESKLDELGIRKSYKDLDDKKEKFGNPFEGSSVEIGE